MKKVSLMSSLVFLSLFAQAALVKDDFNRQNTGYSKNPSVSIGTNWLTGGYSSSFRVYNGTVTESSPAEAMLIYAGGELVGRSCQEKFSVSGVLKLNSTARTGLVGLVFDYLDWNNHKTVTFNGAGDVRLLWKDNGVSKVVFQAAAFSHVANKPFRLICLPMEDNQLKITVEDVQSGRPVYEKVINLPDSGSHWGLAGFYANTSLAAMDEFKLDSTGLYLENFSIAPVIDRLREHHAAPARYVNIKLQEAAAYALETPVINTAPEPKYGYDKLDYGMGLSITMTPGGRIWNLMNPGSDGAEAYVMGTTSDNKGETWSAPRLVVDMHDDRLPFPRSNLDGVIWTDPRGRLWLFINQSMEKFDGRSGVWCSVCENPDGDSPVWSAPVRIADGIACRKPTVLSNGEWLLPVQLESWDVATFQELDPVRGTHAYVSGDQGKTWERRGSIQIASPDCSEHMFVEKNDGTLWATVRTGAGLFESFSSDMGRTWTPSVKAAIAQPPARHFIRRLQSGNLLLVKNGTKWNENPAGVRVGMSAFISKDDGKTWEGGLLLDERGRVSHPDGFQAPDGMIYITTDYERPVFGEVLLHRFREEDVLGREFLTPGAKPKMLIYKPDPEALRKRREAEARGTARPKA